VRYLQNTSYIPSTKTET